LILADYQSGHVFDDHSFEITVSEAKAYANAVGDSSPPASGNQVPPMLLIAAGLSRVIEALELGGGTIHASQEVNFVRPVSPGENIVARTTLRGNSVRRGSRFATVETEFLSGGRQVASSVSMVIVPE
jgi:acyl dehydratase